MKTHNLRNDAEMNEILQNEEYKIYFLQLSASWCAPCVRVTPDVKKLVSSIDNEHAIYIYCDVDKCPNLYEYLNVQGIPAFISIVQNSDKLFDVQKMTSSNIEDIRRFCIHTGIMEETVELQK